MDLDLLQRVDLDNKQKTYTAGKRSWNNLTCFKKTQRPKVTALFWSRCCGKRDVSRWSGLCKTACRVSCVGKGGRDQSGWETLIFRSDRQSNGNFLLAADPQSDQSPEPAIKGPLRGTVDSVTGLWRKWAPATGPTLWLLPKEKFWWSQFDLEKLVSKTEPFLLVTA